MDKMLLGGMMISIIAIGLDSVPISLTGGFLMVTLAILHGTSKENGI
jgi:hypothetical protein